MFCAPSSRADSSKKYGFVEYTHACLANGSFSVGVHMPGHMHSPRPATANARIAVTKIVVGHFRPLPVIRACSPRGTYPFSSMHKFCVPFTDSELVCSTIMRFRNSQTSQLNRMTLRTQKCIIAANLDVSHDRLYFFTPSRDTQGPPRLRSSAGSLFPGRKLTRNH